MKPKLNLKNKGQISKSNEYTDNLHISFCQGQIKNKAKHFALRHCKLYFQKIRLGSVPSISLEVLDLSIQHMMSAFRFDYFPNFDPIVQSSFHHRFLIVFIYSYIFSLKKYKKYKKERYILYKIFLFYFFQSKSKLYFQLFKCFRS